MEKWKFAHSVEGSVEKEGKSTYVRLWQLICSIAAHTCLSNLSTQPACLCSSHLIDWPCGTIEQDGSRGFRASGRWVWQTFGQKLSVGQSNEELKLESPDLNLN